MTPAFQTSNQSSSSLTMAAASQIVETSALALGDDHEATVEIIATTLGTLPTDEVDEFTAWASDPATAVRIVCAALEDAASAGDAATVGSDASATRLPASDTVTPHQAATPMSSMLAMIRAMLPMVEHLVELEEHLVGRAALSAPEPLGGERGGIVAQFISRAWKRPGGQPGRFC